MTLMRRTLRDTLEQAQILWPGLLEQLPMAELQKQALHAHWRSLAIGF